MPFALTATSRTELGRGAKKVRTAGNVPGIIYGHGIEPKAIALGKSEFRKVYRQAGSSSLLDLSVDGGQPLKVLIQEVQPNPLTLEPQHVDLRQINMNEALVIEVPLKFVNESPAVKELAGTLVHAFDSIQVRCLPADLPHEIEIDLSKLKTFDDTITVADLPLSKGVTVMGEPSVTLASVVAPLTEDQLKKLEEGTTIDVTAVKVEADEKKAEKEAKAAEEEKPAA